MRISILVCVFCVVFQWIAEGEISVSIKQKADVALHGMEDSIVRINSGVCRINGQTIEPGGKIVVDNIFVAFDYEKHFYRLDNSDRGRSLITPDFYYEVWKPGSHDASAHRTTLADMECSQWLNMVDVQAIPYFVPVGRKEPFDFRKNYQPKIFVHKLVDYNEDNNDIVRLKFDMVRASGAKSLQMEYFLSKKYGYLPIHIEYSVGYVMDISWQKVKDTCVPVAYSQKSKQGFGVEWRIVWQSVNEPVPVDYFDVTKLSEKEIPLFSTELGERVQIGTFGDNGDVLSNVDVSSNSNYEPFRNTLMGLGIFFIILGLGKKAYDWWRK